MAQIIGNAFYVVKLHNFFAIFLIIESHHNRRILHFGDFSNVFYLITKSTYIPCNYYVSNNSIEYSECPIFYRESDIRTIPFYPLPINTLCFTQLIECPSDTENISFMPKKRLYYVTIITVIVCFF